MRGHSSVAKHDSFRPRFVSPGFSHCVPVPLSHPRIVSPGFPERKKESRHGRPSLEKSAKARNCLRLRQAHRRIAQERHAENRVGGATLLLQVLLGAMERLADRSRARVDPREEEVAEQAM